MRYHSLATLGALLFSACTHAPVNQTVFPEYPLLGHCSVFSISGDLLWSFPAPRCLPFSDGRFAAGTDENLALYSPDRKVIWEKKISNHHMINRAANGDLLVMSSEMLPVKSHTFKNFLTYDFLTEERKTYKSLPASWKGMSFRKDQLLRISPEGRIIAERRFGGDFYDYPTVTLLTNLPGGAKKNLEASHVNSFYEIPPNASTMPAFAAGNFVVNDSTNRFIFILDPSLQKTLWKMDYRELGYQLAHDVQVLPSGHLLFFVNFRSDIPDKSSVDEVDPGTRTIVSSIKDGFFAPYKGSVQPLPKGNFLCTTGAGANSWAKIMDSQGQVLWTLNLNKLFPSSAQGAYSLSVLGEFLAHATQP